MAKTLQFKRFSSTILANTTGASGELIIDSTKNLVTVHDGSTPGGWPVARESVINAINNAQSINIQQSRDTANLALVQANLAFVQINADLNLQGGLNSANANIALLQGSMVTSNANIALLQNKVYANTNVASYLTSRGINTYGDSNVISYLNSANANIALLQGAMSTSNDNIAMLIGIQTTQNTNITLSYNQANTAANLAQASFNFANAISSGVVIDALARTTANTATNNVVILQGVNASQNVRLDYSNTAITIIQGTDTSQNTRMSVIEGNLTSAYAKANTNISSDLTLTVTNSGVGAYLIDGSSNPTVTLYRGVTYYFNINAAGHPLYIQTVSGAYSSGNVYTSGVTGGGTQVGTLTFTVPLDAPSNLYYVCQNHSAMNGAFVIKNLISTINTQNNNISITQLKSLANSSATYSDFRTAIASL